MSPLILIKFSCFLPLPSHISWHVQVIILLIGSIQLPIIIISCLMILKTNFLTFIFSNFWKRKLNWIQIWWFCAKKFQIDQLLDLGELLNLSYYSRSRLFWPKNNPMTKMELKKSLAKLVQPFRSYEGICIHTLYTYRQTKILLL